MSLWLPRAQRGLCVPLGSLPCDPGKGKVLCLFESEFLTVARGLPCCLLGGACALPEKHRLEALPNTTPPPAFSPSAACGPVCVCGHPHHREHRDCHHAASVHVRLHRGPAFQGETLALPSPVSVPRRGPGRYSQKRTVAWVRLGMKVTLPSAPRPEKGQAWKEALPHHAKTLQPLGAACPSGPAPASGSKGRQTPLPRNLRVRHLRKTCSGSLFGGIKLPCLYPRPLSLLPEKHPRSREPSVLGFHSFLP